MTPRVSVRAAPVALFAVAVVVAVAFAQGDAVHGAAVGSVAVRGVAAQGAAVQGDPVTGKWGADGVTYLDLQYNREGVVTGTTIWRHSGGYEEHARITKGTFDGETGRMQLAGEAKNRDGKVVSFLIDGRLQKDKIAGTYQMGSDKGEFSFTRLGQPK